MITLRSAHSAATKTRQSQFLSVEIDSRETFVASLRVTNHCILPWYLHKRHVWWDHRWWSRLQHLAWYILHWMKFPLSATNCTEQLVMLAKAAVTIQRPRRHQIFCGTNSSSYMGNPSQNQQRCLNLSSALLLPSVDTGWQYISLHCLSLGDVPVGAKCPLITLPPHPIIRAWTTNHSNQFTTACSRERHRC